MGSCDNVLTYMHGANDDLHVSGLGLKWVVNCYQCHVYLSQYCLYYVVSCISNDERKLYIGVFAVK